MIAARLGLTVKGVKYHAVVKQDGAPAMTRKGTMPPGSMTQVTEFCNSHLVAPTGVRTHHSNAPDHPRPSAAN